MNFGLFQRTCRSVWLQHLKGLAAKHPAPAVACAPNIVLATETADHFVVELLGVQRGRVDLELKAQRIRTTTAGYLGQFREQTGTTFLVCGGGADHPTIFSDLLIARDADLEKMCERFAFLKGWRSAFRVSGSGPLIDVQPDTAISIRETALLNRQADLFRARYIQYLSVWPKSMSIDDFESKLASDARASVLRLEAWTHSETTFRTIGQFTSLFLSPGVHETKLSLFVDQHADFLPRALGYLSQCPHPKLEWLEGNPDPHEKFIIPDVLLKRPDDCYDICDLKTAELEQRSVTTGRHRRRRFIEVVQDGLAQLANYAEYFSHTANQDFAWKRYGVAVDKPKLILVIGTYDNVHSDEVREASRILSPDVQIVDYETLMFLYRSRFPGGAPMN